MEVSDDVVIHNSLMEKLGLKEKGSSSMKKNPKICFVSSSGGHWEQLQKLKPLADKYEGFL